MWIWRLGADDPAWKRSRFSKNRDRLLGGGRSRQWIEQVDLTRPTVFVTHQVVVTALSQVIPGSGEIAAMQRGADRRLSIQGRLPTA